MTAIYIAATFARRVVLRHSVVAPLQAKGYEVTSRWIFEGDGPVLGQDDLIVDPTLGEVPGTECLADVKRADMVAVLTDIPSSTGGYHVELGYALALGKSIAIVGPPLNVFHTLPTLKKYPTISTFLREMGCV